MDISLYWASCKYLLFGLILMTLEILTDFLKNTEILNVMKMSQVEANLFHVDRQTDKHDKANRHFSQFCECA
jgi:hypothetical protein